jgi:hypothetical protein
MANIDPERERGRLAEFYSGQMDGELQQVAGQAYALTEVAREALRAELAKRGLPTELMTLAPIPSAPPVLAGDPTAEPAEEKTPQDGELEFRRMVTIRKFRDLPEALLARGSLDSAGIDCTLVDENVVRLDWFWSNLMGGVKLQVGAEDVPAAEEILTQPIPEHFVVSGIGDYEQPRCPKCGSLDVNFREIDPAAYLSMAVSVPIPFHRSAWRCRSCHVEWEDDAADGASESTS